MTRLAYNLQKENGIVVNNNSYIRKFTLPSIITIINIAIEEKNIKQKYILMYELTNENTNNLSYKKKKKLAKMIRSHYRSFGYATINILDKIYIYWGPDSYSFFSRIKKQREMKNTYNVRYYHY